MLDPALAVAEDLYVFRCLVTIGLDEPQPVETLGEVELFSRLYAVTAASYAQASEWMEEWAGRAADESGRPLGSTRGFLEDIEISVMDPEDLDQGLIPADRARSAGVHFASEALRLEDEQ